MEKKLYVGNLSYNVTDDQLRSHFEQAGSVESANVIVDRQTNRSKGFGFVEMASEDEAKAAIKRLEEGADFAELAKELSTGPTGPNGGDLGYFGVNDMVSEFATVAFSLDKGEYTKEPVKTQFGYHVIKMVDSRTKPNPTLEELAPSIEAELRRAALEDMVAQWREKVEIEQFDINGKPIKEGANAFGQVEPASN